MATTAAWSPNQALVAQVETEWRRVPLNPEYSVSNKGDVFDTVKRSIVIPRPSGKHCLQLFLRGQPNRITSPGRLVLEAFVGPCPEGMECCHWDDDQSNNDVSNLRWGTKKDNGEDRVRNGLSAEKHGEINGMALLTDEKVLEARSLRKEDPKQWTWKALGTRYGVNRHTARLAVIGKTWTHLEGC